MAIAFMSFTKKGVSATEMQAQLGHKRYKPIWLMTHKTSYADTSKFVEDNVTEKSDIETTQITLRWVHIAISNAKRTLLGIYHKIDGKYLQRYLDEFCYKLNRRYFWERLFDRLLIVVSNILAV